MVKKTTKAVPVKTGAKLRQGAAAPRAPRAPRAAKANAAVSKPARESTSTARGMRVSPAFDVLRGFVIAAMARAKVPTTEIAAKLGHNRSYIIKRAHLTLTPATPVEQAILATAREYESQMKRAGVGGLMSGVDLTTTLAGGERPKIGTLQERRERAAPEPSAPKAVKQSKNKAPKPTKAPKAEKPAKPTAAPTPAKRKSRAKPKDQAPAFTQEELAQMIPDTVTDDVFAEDQYDDAGADEVFASATPENNAQFAADLNELMGENTDADNTDEDTTDEDTTDDNIAAE